MAFDAGPSTRVSVRDAFARVELALRRGDALQLGEAHLDAVAALARSIQGEPPEAGHDGVYRLMIGQADEALEAYQSVDFAWGIADAHLVKAALLSDRVGREREADERQAGILQCIDHCHQALTLLHRGEGVPVPLLRQAHTTAGAVLLNLREALRDLELPDSFEAWIATQAESVGELTAWEARLRSEGNDWLWMARVCATLAASLREADARRQAARAAQTAARHAAGRLRLTGDGAATRAAWSIARASRAAGSQDR